MGNAAASVARTIRWAFNGALSGGALGTLTASFLGPKFITWYNAPGSARDAMCQCAQVVESTTREILSAQFWGAAIGAISGILTALTLLWYLRKRRIAKSRGAGASDPSAGPSSRF